MLRRFIVMMLACLAGCSMPSKLATPLPQAHAHNDYAHGRPLHDALDAGFCSIEVDICLVGGKLMVAHSVEQVTPGRTLESLYLDPLRKRVATQAGRVYRDGPSVILLVDFKTDWRQTYPKVRRALRKYADFLTTWRDGRERRGAVTIVLTGKHPPANVVTAEKIRYAAIDGPLDDNERDVPPSVLSHISVDWRPQFTWKGIGDFPPHERAHLKQLVDRVHARSRTIRLWAAPDQPRMWQELLDAGVDYIDTDDLSGLRSFLLTRSRPIGSQSPAGD